ncbi:MAG: D-alanyl-D-alanine carboxypeptidase family protein [Ilumatobacteraceae bacterium]
MVVRRALVVFVASVLAACSASTGERSTRSTAAATATLAPPSTTAAATTAIAPSTTATTSTTSTTSTTIATTTTVPAPTTTAVPAVEAAAYSVYDQRTGTVLAANNADTQLAVGSLMKLLAADVAYTVGDPVKVVTAPDGLVIDPEESIIGIRPGQQLQRDTLTRAMLVVSANDAARALAIDIAGSEAAFAELMNQRAAALGLTNTRAVNATGLDAEGQYSTANDLVRLGAFLMGNPTFQASARQQSATLNDQTLPNTNDLLRTYPATDGIKTGRTTQAGWCILASANRAGRRIIVAVLGAPTEEARDAAATALLDWGFTQP